MHGLFTRCCEQGLLSSCGAQASHCGGFSCCGPRALWPMGFHSCGTWAVEWGSVVGSVVAAPRHGLKGCGVQTWLPCCMWDLPGLGIEPVSPALASGLFTTEPPRNPSSVILTIQRNFKEREGWESCRDRRTLKERVNSFNYQRYLNP